jgi:hypothetical protein
MSIANVASQLTISAQVLTPSITWLGELPLACHDHTDLQMHLTQWVEKIFVHIKQVAKLVVCWWVDG